MNLSELSDLAILLSFAILLVMFAVPPLLLFWLYLSDRRQSRHAVLRNFPLLGRLRYLFEHIGPELRQYLFDGDEQGKPLSREEYRSIVVAGKYNKTLVSFGSKRDFDEPGWYLRNAMFPTQMGDLAVITEPRIRTRSYEIEDEGLFRRDEHSDEDEVRPWLLAPESAIEIGAGLPEPWTLRGLLGMSAMSYGSLGRNAIRALSEGLGMASGSWVNTGEGGLSEHHLAGGGDVVFQIGPGMFGVRTPAGEWDWDRFQSQAAIPQVRGFELKLHQGAKIRGGHVEGAKVTPEIAAIRGVVAGRAIDSPNRFPIFATLDAMLDHVARMRALGGKPVGIKIVVGGPGSTDELAEALARRGEGPDWITVDGGEGGSGATYQEMADSMGLPLRSGLVLLDDSLRRAGVRDRLRIFASGKLFSPDRMALALCLGADALNVARGMMVSVGCIQAMRCHTNTCPVGVATTDETLMQALVVDEKRYRVLNYVVTMRAALFSLAAAAGLRSPTEFGRSHAVHRDAYGRTRSAEDLFPTPEASRVPAGGAGRKD